MPTVATAKLLSYMHCHNMSKITATINLDNTWTIEEIGLGTNRYDVEFHINSDSTFIPVEQLQFGYALNKANEVIARGSFPTVGRYISIASTHLETAPLTVEYDTDYVLDVWAVNNSQMFQASITFTTGRPVSPWTSWVWNGVAWTAPIEQPTGRYTDWNEETKTWVDV